jgi:hypothetical protein
MANIRPAVAITILLLGFGPAARGASFVRVVSSRTRTSSVNSSIAGTVGSSGVAAGDSVVVRANFLLDSESRLRGALGAGAQGGHGSHSDGTP